MNTKIDQTIAEQQPVLYKCRVNIRPFYRGHEARESILLLNGFEVTLQCDGRQFDHDIYPNEALFMPCTEQIRKLFLMYGLKYLAEGDLVILEKVEPADWPEDNMLVKPAERKKRPGNPKH